MLAARLAPALLATLVLATRVGAVVPVPWRAAGEHVRRLVTIEGVVARATTTAERRCVLEFAPDDPTALRVVMTIPLITELPADPSRLYQGKRVQVTGRVSRFRDRLEMFVTPAQIEVVGLTAAPPPPEPPPPAPSAPPASVTPSPSPSASASAPPVASAPGAVTSPPATAPSAPGTLPPPAIVDPRCGPWRAQRSAIRDELRALVRRLEECLAADRPGCAALGDPLGPPLSRLAEVEERLGVACP